jgi:hypothetical protein
MLNIQKHASLLLKSVNDAEVVLYWCVVGLGANSKK